MVISVKLISDPQTIFNYLKESSPFPVDWNSFPEIIFHDFNHFSAKFLVLIEEGKVLSHALIYHIDNTTLYFGHVHAINEESLSMLIEELKIVARKQSFLKIIGPINIPTILYGWGFLEKGGDDTLSLAKPINPPWVQETFFKKDFKVKVEYYTWEGFFVDMKSDPPQINGLGGVRYEYNDFEILHPETWEEIKALKKEYFLLSGTNLASESQVTPDVINLFDNYLKFVITYGDPFMFSFLKHKPSNTLVGLINALPNPFKQLEQAKSFVIFLLVLNQEFRNKKLGMWMTHDLLTRGILEGYTHFSAPIERHQMESQGLAKKLGLSHTRTHLVLESDL